jgi:hypothetical protein
MDAFDTSFVDLFIGSIISPAERTRLRRQMNPNDADTQYHIV